ncbi:sulfatase-like hydrolase/transferase [Limnobacter parvus]|uniref:Sulfatase-like hydrolase/transferase n=1 Tax=Limnobacter parvus TaxID=2939690 RepID=A0ABT1XEX7_9BURK|nr:sulfatase-like hydrolase/transferase [Limnobacter parvus]MCR2745694.1 sulfatase-like hydrolase/transferase [Limnobacter parvus]
MSSSNAALPTRLGLAASNRPDFSKWRFGGQLLLALIFLNSTLCFSAIWPTVYVRPDLGVSSEFLCLIMLLSAWVALFGKPSARALGVISAIYLIMAFGHYANVVVPNLLGRPVNLYWDVPQLPRFVWVTVQGLPVWLTAAVLMLGCAAVWVYYRLLLMSMKTVTHSVQPVARSFRLWAALLLVSVIVVANYSEDPQQPTFVSKAVVPVYWKEAKKLRDILVPWRAAKLLPATTVINDALADPDITLLGALKNRDVHMIFLETYGAVLYDQKESSDAVAQTRAELQQSILASGRKVVSAFYVSPTIGGASDLAHLSVLSGIDLKDSRKHDVLLTTDRPTLMDVFEREGYETFGLYHSVGWDWVERDFYSYDQYIHGPDLGYEGPAFGFWKIPDQYAAARIEQLHPRNSSAKPRFLFFPTINSHFPFHQVPPYQDDWNKLLGPQPFDAQAAAKAQAETVSWDFMKPDYLRTINYTNTWLAGYFRQPEPRETVYVMIGDHQPTGSVSHEATPWDVPVFIVSRDDRLLDQFRAMGFTDGLTPKQRAPMGGLHDLTAVLLKGFGG